MQRTPLTSFAQEVLLRCCYNVYLDLKGMFTSETHCCTTEPLSQHMSMLETHLTTG